MIKLDADKRARIAAAKADIAEIMKPLTEAQRKARKEARRAEMKRVGKRAAGQRQPRVKENAYLAFIRRHPCEVCGTTRRIEAAHVRSGYPEAGWRPTGMQEKPDDRRTLPLCADHHREGPKAQHAARERDWWASHGINPPDRCAELSAEYDGPQSRPQGAPDGPTGQDGQAPGSPHIPSQVTNDQHK